MPSNLCRQAFRVADSGLPSECCSRFRGGRTGRALISGLLGQEADPWVQVEQAGDHIDSLDQGDRLVATDVVDRTSVAAAQGEDSGVNTVGDKSIRAGLLSVAMNLDRTAVQHRLDEDVVRQVGR